MNRNTSRRLLLILSAWLLFGGLVCLSQAQVPMTGAGKGAPGAAVGPVTVDATGTFATAAPATSPVDYTGITVGSGNALLAYLETGIGTTITGIDWDQSGTPQAMSFIGRLTLTSTRSIEFWGLLAPAAGNKTMRISVSPAVGGMSVISAVSFNGVNKSSIAAAFPNFGTTGITNGVSSIAVTISSGLTHIVAAASSDDTGVPNATAITGTALYLNNVGAVAVVGGYDTGSASKTMTATYSGNGNLGIIGVDVSP